MKVDGNAVSIWYIIPKTMKSEKQNLTAKEHEVLKLISMGFTNGSIAEEMSISINTVKYHLKNIFNKLRARNRVEALNKFQRHQASIYKIKINH